jgi:hypothetical protein
VVDLHAEAKFLGFVLDGLGEIKNAEHLRELVKGPVLTRLRGVKDGKFHAAQGVANIQEASRLAALAVYGERNAGNRLDAKAVQGRAENFVVVEAVARRSSISDSSVATP